MDVCPVSVQLEGNNSALWNLVMRLLVVTSFVLGGSSALVVPPPMPHARIATQRSAAPAMLDGPTIDSSAVVALFSVGVAGGAAYALAQQQANPTPTARKPRLNVSARKHPGRPRRIRSPRMSARCAPPVMIDTNMILGGVLLVGGTAAGAAGLYFVEQQGERTNERGGMSEETRARMAGKFMEDEEGVVSYTDTISKMEAALAKAEGRDVEEDLDEATKAKLDAEKLDDGWDD